MEIHEQITFSPLNLASIGNAKSLTLNTRKIGNTKSTNNKLGAFLSAFNRFKSSSRVALNETNENKKAISISKAYFILNEDQQKNFDSLQKLIELVLLEKLFDLK